MVVLNLCLLQKHLKVASIKKNYTNKYEKCNSIREIQKIAYLS